MYITRSPSAPGETRGETRDDPRGDNALVMYAVRVVVNV